MTTEVDHSGYIVSKDNEHFAYDFKEGVLTLHLYDAIPEIDGSNTLLTRSFDNKRYLFFSQLPLQIGEMHLFPITFNYHVDWLIQGYETGSKFDKVIFSFDELQYFCPSASVVQQEDNKIIFLRELKEIKKFTFELMGTKCEACFCLGTNGKTGFANSYMQAETILTITFEATDNMEFIQKIYQLVDSVFSFICNRRNTGCVSMELRGIYPAKTIEEKKIVDCIKRCKSYMYFFDKYREDVESKKVISKTFNASPFLVHIDNLFELVAKDIDDIDDKCASISISSVHPSVKRRMLIDLQQSLQITGAFEFYVRRYLPDMTEEKSHHAIMKMLLKEFAENNSVNNKARKLALSLERNVIREPALEDKIVKAYEGYDDWRPLKNCLKQGWFDEEEIRALAKEANEWRNELAHSKRSYEPNERTIHAVRLMEHMNYSIVLRELGYTDDEIADLLEFVLVR